MANLEELDSNSNSKRPAKKAVKTSVVAANSTSTATKGEVKQITKASAEKHIFDEFADTNSVKPKSVPKEPNFVVGKGTVKLSDGSELVSKSDNITMGVVDKVASVDTEPSGVAYTSLPVEEAVSTVINTVADLPKIDKPVNTGAVNTPNNGFKSKPNYHKTKQAFDNNKTKVKQSFKSKDKTDIDSIHPGAEKYPEHKVRIAIILKHNAEIRRYTSLGILNYLIQKGHISNGNSRFVDFQWDRFKVIVDGISKEYAYSESFFLNCLVASFASFAYNSQKIIDTFTSIELDKRIEEVVDTDEVDKLAINN